MKQDDISPGDQIVSPEDGISKTTSDVNLNVLQNEDKHNRGAATKAMTVVLLLTFSVVFLSLNRPSPSTTRRIALASSSTYEHTADVVTPLSAGGQIDPASYRNSYVTLTTKSSSKLTAGVAVSFSGAGRIQRGGGTSIYRNVASIPSDPCPKYLSASSIFDDKYLVSFKSPSTQKGVISVMSVDVSKKLSAVLSTAYSGEANLYRVMVLNRATGLFVRIFIDESTSLTTSLVGAGQVDTNNNYKITFGNTVDYGYLSRYSFSPAITALSTTTFAIAFYGGSDGSSVPSVYTRFCVVDPSTLAVALSDPMLIADNSKYSTDFAITAMSAYQYLAVYYVGESSDEAVSAVVIKAEKYPTNSTYYVKPLGRVARLPGSLVSGIIRATTLNSNTFVVAYSDRNSNYGITSVLVKADPVRGEVNFISVLQITTGYSAEYISSGTVDISLVTISGGSQFLILFSNLGIDGALVAAIGTYTGSTLVRGSPNFILSSGMAMPNTYHYYTALAVSKSTAYGSSIAILSALVDVKCVGRPITDFSVMEILPKPVGFTISATDSRGGAQVGVDGVISGFKGLSVGNTYYSTTQGTIISSGENYGREPATSSSSSMEDHFYAEDTAAGVIVSASSQVGIALSSSSIMMRAN